MLSETGIYATAIDDNYFMQIGLRRLVIGVHLNFDPGHFGVSSRDPVNLSWTSIQIVYAVTTIKKYLS